MDIWQRERTLAWTTMAWGAASLAAGLGVAATTSEVRRRSFGLQTAGWGAVDVGIAMVGLVLQDRRMRRLPDPYVTSALEKERIALRRILLVNVAADLGYVALGVRLARDPRPRVAGSGVAIVAQGAFLVLHDGVHAIGTA